MSDNLFDFFTSMEGPPESVPPVVPMTAPEPTVESPFSLFGDTVPPPEPQALTEAPVPSEPQEPETNAAFIGKHVSLKELPYTLNKKQKNYADIASRHIYVAGNYPTGQSIYDMWPSGLTKNGVSASITDPNEISRVVLAGFRPMINDLQGYLESSEYAQRMLELGIVVNTEATGLTSEQMGLLTILSNYADGKSLRSKLRDAGIPWPKFQAWQSQPVFSRYYNQIGGDALKSSMPIAKQQIAAKVAAGDMQGIKLAMEMTGEYDPKGQKQVDAQAMLRIVLEVLEEEIKDPNILRNIGTKITLRGQKEMLGS